ncbi:MAG: hypothetical protein ACETWG_04130, partial [Candidatus Neomarinimicrobiota bacterium]
MPEDRSTGPVTDSQPLATMAYNPAGERVMKEDPDGETLYHHSGGNVIMEDYGSSQFDRYIYGA